MENRGRFLSGVELCSDRVCLFICSFFILSGLNRLGITLGDRKFLVRNCGSLK